MKEYQEVSQRLSLLFYSSHPLPPAPPPGHSLRNLGVLQPGNDCVLADSEFILEPEKPP